MEIVKKRVSELLNRQFNYESHITPHGHQVMINVPGADYEKATGKFTPGDTGTGGPALSGKTGHLYIIIADLDCSHKNSFKI